LYITDEIDELLGVSHLKEYYIVSNFDDRLKLEEIAYTHNVKLKGVVVYPYEDTELYDVAKQMGFEGIMPVIVANVLFDHGDADIVSLEVCLRGRNVLLSGRRRSDPSLTTNWPKKLLLKNDSNKSLGKYYINFQACMQ